MKIENEFDYYHKNSEVWKIDFLQFLLILAHFIANFTN